MILWLINHFGFVLKNVASRTTGDSRVFLTARIAGSSLAAFLAAVLLGPVAIRWLKRRFRERIASDSATLNRLHAAKQDTPTMGGIFLMAAVLLSTLLFADLTSPLIRIAAAAVVSLTLLGAWDDWTKQRTTRNGLPPRQKLLWQSIIAVSTGFLLFREQRELLFGTDLVWPLGNLVVPLGSLFVIWVAFVIVGTCNAVNLTDGLDGLAAGCTILCGAAFVALTYLAGHSTLAEYLRIPHFEGAGELAVMVGALVGAMLGFLWFNCFPAQVFMGDAGALPTGGLLAIAAVAVRQEVLLAVIGGIFVVETLSVMLQVGCYRLTGRRVLRCSPLHNHFVFRGDSETKIVIRFWIVAALLAIAGVASLKLH
ncbi:MAG: phospho-N-acetylmuramoyl-pentapeptide-transferase [Fuerstiella sp.]